MQIESPAHQQQRQHLSYRSTRYIYAVLEYTIAIARTPTYMYCNILQCKTSRCALLSTTRFGAVTVVGTNGDRHRSSASVVFCFVIVVIVVVVVVVVDSDGGGGVDGGKCSAAARGIRRATSRATAPVDLAVRDRVKVWRVFVGVVDGGCCRRARFPCQHQHWRRRLRRVQFPRARSVRPVPRTGTRAGWPFWLASARASMRSCES